MIDACAPASDRPAPESWLRVRAGHHRSADVARDFEDGRGTRYVVTPFIKTTMARVARGLAEGAVERAWRLTGDYGSGKSSFALALARLASGAAAQLPAELRGRRDDARLEPVLVSGGREAIAASVLMALRGTMVRTRLPVPAGLEATLSVGASATAAEVLVAVDAVGAAVRSAGLADGLLVVLDELGKNLEFAGSRPQGEDVFVLQGLAEAAARSGSSPLMVVAVLHQSIAAYAGALSSAERREWEKVAGRFEEVVFLHPVEQTATLVASWLDVDVHRLPRRLSASAAATMRKAVASGWFGHGASPAAMSSLASRLLPLDPTTLPVLGRTLRRFGQSERSLFGFMSSSETGALLDFSNRPSAASRPYRVSDLYDYVSSNLTGAIESSPRATQWGTIDAVVRSAAVEGGVELDVLKTVGLLNLLDDPSIPATREMVALCVGGAEGEAAGEAARAVDALAGPSGFLFDRGRAGGLCLWPHTSVDLDEALVTAERALGVTPHVATALLPLLAQPPIVARRHYIQTGTLRQFDVAYATSDRMGPVVDRLRAEAPRSCDGHVLIILCDAEHERAEAMAVLERGAPPLPATVLVGIPEPVGFLRSALHEAQVWSWVRDNTPELVNDRFAQLQVLRQADMARDRLERALLRVADLRGGASTLPGDWFQAGKRLSIRDGRELLEMISSICDRTFAAAPLVRNELINRRSLSSAAARARFELIEGLAGKADHPFLGMEPAQTPPEMAIYMSVLRAGNVHVLREGTWRVEVPDAGDDPLRLRPSVLRIGELLRSSSDARMPYPDLAEELRRAPYGVRDGLFPLLLSVYLAANWHRTAVFEDGSYLEQVGAPEFARMLKEPEHFALQHCAVEGVRAEVFLRLAEVVGVSPSGRSDILDVVRPLCRFVAKLPDHARRTKAMSGVAVAVRSAILDARDPTRLVFRELPAACGLEPIGPDGSLDDAQVSEFVRRIGSAVGEMREAYPKLLDRVAEALSSSLETEGGLVEARRSIATRCTRLAGSVTEPELRAFVLRLCDGALHDRGWVESLASLVARKPPERWADPDEVEYLHRLSLLAQRLRRVEAAMLDGGGRRPDDGDGDRVPLRIVVTSADGREAMDVFRSGSDAGTARLEAELGDFIALHGRAGLAAAARALLAALLREAPGEAEVDGGTRRSRLKKVSA